MNLDSNTGPKEGLDLDEEEDYVLRVMTSKPHLIKGILLLKNLEKVGMI